MTKDTHTPGPWLADWENEDDFDGVQIRVKGREEYVPISNVPVDYSDRTEREANARLIAAAPDLLEALEWIKENAQSVPFSSVQGVAREAIAKARGQS